MNTVTSSGPHSRHGLEKHGHKYSFCLELSGLRAVMRDESWNDELAGDGHGSEHCSFRVGRVELFEYKSMGNLECLGAVPRSLLQHTPV